MKGLEEQIEIIKRSREFVVIDIETSHFSPEKGAMIIELAAVKIRDGKIVDSRSQLIDPERKITKQITEITKITNEMLEGRPKFREVLPNFYKFIGNATIVAHNAKFDWDRFLMFYFKKVGIEPLNEVVCTMSLSKMYLKNEDKKYTLGYLCEMVNVKLDNAHRALSDTTATAELFLHIKDNFITNGNQVAMDFKPIEESKKAASPQKIRSVSYWEKTLKSGHVFQRIYVTLERSAVFYDIPTKSWEVKESNEPIDFVKVQQDVLKRYELNTLEDLIDSFTQKESIM